MYGHYLNGSHFSLDNNDLLAHCNGYCSSQNSARVRNMQLILARQRGKKKKEIL